MRIEVIRALGPKAPDIQQVTLELPEGASVADALALSGLDAPALAGYAIYGEPVNPSHPLRDGDRLELLRPLQLDPKQARRRRAQMQRGKTTAAL